MTVLIEDIIHDVLNCPVCAEDQYIKIMVIAEGLWVTFYITCLSCCYDGSQQHFKDDYGFSYPVGKEPLV